MCPVITGFRVSSDAGLCLHYISHRLLQCTAGGYTEGYERLLNAAARLVSDTRKFHLGLRQFMHVDLNWLDMPEWVKFELVSMVHNCLHHKAPGTWWTTAFQCDVARRQHLCSARRHYLVVPQHILNSYQLLMKWQKVNKQFQMVSDNVNVPSINSFKNRLDKPGPIKMSLRIISITFYHIYTPWQPLCMSTFI